MPEQATNPQQGESKPRTNWDIGKAMNGFFPQREEPEATDREEEEQDLDTDEAPEASGTAPDDEEEQDEASGGEDADPEDDGASDEPFLTLKVDGKDITIGSKEEVIPLAQKGMHYTQEMQKLRDREAQLASEAEQSRQAVRQKEGQYETALQTLHDTYGFVLGQDPPDWAGDEMQKLKAEKPEEYLAIREQWDQLGAIRGELTRIQQEKQKEAEKQWKDWVGKEQAALAEKRPEWTDRTRREQDFTLIRDYATAQGVTEQEIGNLFDHRFWLILHDAARYRQAEATGKKKREAVKSKTAEPGSGRDVNQGNRRIRATRDTLRKTGDVRAAGDILQELMTRRGK